MQSGGYTLRMCNDYGRHAIARRFRYLPQETSAPFYLITQELRRFLFRTVRCTSCAQDNSTGEIVIHRVHPHTGFTGFYVAYFPHSSFPNSPTSSYLRSQVVYMKPVTPFVF